LVFFFNIDNELEVGGRKGGGEELSRYGNRSYKKGEYIWLFLGLKHFNFY
jgi:hypothetical protein